MPEHAAGIANGGNDLAKGVRVKKTPRTRGQALRTPVPTKAKSAPPSTQRPAAPARPPASAKLAKSRLDALLVERGLAPSRDKATRLVLAGAVQVDGRRVDKGGTMVDARARLEVVQKERFVSRGGDKLAHALTAFGLNPSGRICVDVGASTGGFTHCLLEGGAKRVYAVDVGQGQLDATLRADGRVVVMERTNARQLSVESFPELPQIATVDVSFISLEKVLPAVAACLASPVEIVALVKPQFEVGRGQVGKGGVVRAVESRRDAVRRVADVAAGLGLRTSGVAASVLPGPKGNREVFLHLARDLGPRAPLEGEELEAALAAAVPAEAVGARRARGASRGAR
jgi:23S rRNA (cytidine1920-2'-O)/16S rRNA (cytidine1409-2'-O)-methyltransferase